jgi:hypothetical protein
MYSQSVQEADDAGRSSIEPNRRNDRTHLEKKKDFQLPEIVKSKPRKTQDVNYGAIA